MTTTVEGRERYAIRVRYPRALRDDPEVLKRIYIPTASGQQILLGDLVDIRYEQGAQAIKSEDGFLIGYVLFDREQNYSEVEVVNNAQQYLLEQIDNGSLEVPSGINYRFAGNYEQQVRASKRLAIVVPIALALIFLILYFQFKSVTISLMVFTGVFIAFAGGFIMIGLYDTEWFLNFHVFGVNMRDLFQIRTINLSVAVWVGFLAHDDYGYDNSSFASGAYLYGTWSRYYATYGNSFFWWDDLTNDHHVYRTRVVFPLARNSIINEQFSINKEQKRR